MTTVIIESGATVRWKCGEVIKVRFQFLQEMW